MTSHALTSASGEYPRRSELEDASGQQRQTLFWNGRTVERREYQYEDRNVTATAVRKCDSLRYAYVSVTSRAFVAYRHQRCVTPLRSKCRTSPHLFLHGVVLSNTATTYPTTTQTHPNDNRN